MVKACGVVRVALLLAIGCLATCHGSMEQETVALHELGGSDIDADPIDAGDTEDDASGSNYQIEAEDQEDRIGVSSVDDFDQDDAPPANKRASDPDFDNELKVIQDDGDDNRSLGESDSDESPESISASASTVEQTTKSSERVGKISDKAIESKKKQDELMNKEADARDKAKRAAEVDNKESHAKAAKSSEERYSKKTAEEASSKAQNNELKEKDDQETNVMEAELKRSRHESEIDGKRDTANEKKDKASETRGKASSSAESKEKAAESDRVAAEDAKVKEANTKDLAARAAKNKAEADAAAEEKKVGEMRELEQDKAQIKEKGNKAYANELTLEGKQKSEMQDQDLEKEKAVKSREASSKQAVGNEISQKASETQSKFDKRDEALSAEQKKASQADEQAHKAGFHERSVKQETMEVEKVYNEKLMDVDSSKKNAELASKAVKRAFSNADKKAAMRQEKLAKSRVSEVQSKVTQEAEKMHAAQVKRELAGKIGRERANKFSDVQNEHVKSLLRVKEESKKQLEDARKARAQVQFLHSRLHESDSKEDAHKLTKKMSALKAEVRTADQALVKRNEDMTRTNAIEKDDEEGQKKAMEKNSKYTKSHAEEREKTLQLAKQRVQSWVKYDRTLSKKLNEMQVWKKSAEKSAKAAGNNAVAAEKAVEGHARGAERAKKKRQEVKEKENMNGSFKELMHKDDAKEKQDALMKMAEEKELIQKDKDREERVEEQAEKISEVTVKAHDKEKESLEKMNERHTKSSETKLSTEKDGKKETKAKTSMEKSQKSEVEMDSKLTRAKLAKESAQANSLRKGQTPKEKSNTAGVFDQKNTAYEAMLAKEKTFKLNMDNKKSALTAQETAIKEAEKISAKAEAKFEQVVKDELANKNDVKEKAETKGKTTLKEMGEKSKLKEQQAAAAAEARKAVRVAEKAAKDIQQGRDKDEREQKQYTLQDNIEKELTGKKGAATLKASEAQAAAGGKDAVYKHSELVLGENLKKQERWKEKLDALRKAESFDREKELKALPYRIVVAEQVKYRKQATEQQRTTDSVEKEHESNKAQYQAKEITSKRYVGKEKMLKEEKRTMLKRLSEAVREEYKTGKRLKRDRTKMDEDQIEAQKSKGKLNALERYLIGQQQLEDAAKKKSAALAEEAKKDATLSSNKESALSDEQSKADASAGEDGMKADVAEGGAQEKAQKSESVDKSKATSLQAERNAVAEQAAETAKNLKAEKAVQDEIKYKADAKRRQSENRIIELKSHIAKELSDKGGKEKEMKKEEKKTTSNVSRLRRKEMKTKHAEIEERSLMDNEAAKVAEIQKARADSDHRYNANKELLTKAEERVKMATSVITNSKNSKGAYNSKETGVKTSIANSHQKYNEENAADRKLRAELDRITRAHKDAEATLASADVHYKRATEDEQNSKHDALELNKKSEAKAIEKAVERKNKAAEKTVKAFKHQSEIKKKQYFRVKNIKDTLANTLTRLETSKSLLGTKYGMTDEWQVDKMSKVAGEDVEFSEAKEKSASRVVEETSTKAKKLSDDAGHWRMKLSKATAELKKFTDLVNAKEHAKEAAAKQKSLAHKEGDIKSATKELSATSMASRIAIMRQEKGKFQKTAMAKSYRKAAKAETAARVAVDNASAARLKATQASLDAKQHQESSAKIADRFRGLGAQIMEKGNKAKKNTADVASQEKGYKFTVDQVKKATSSCTTGKKATRGIGKAFAKLKTEMKSWSLKHKWLKQKKPPVKDDSVGEGRGNHVSIVEKTSSDLVDEEMRDDMPSDSMSVVELIQMAAGPDVAEWIFT